MPSPPVLALADNKDEEIVTPSKMDENAVKDIGLLSSTTPVLKAIGNASSSPTDSDIFRVFSSISSNM